MWERNSCESTSKISLCWYLEFGNLLFIIQIILLGRNFTKHLTNAVFFYNKIWAFAFYKWRDLRCIKIMQYCYILFLYVHPSIEVSFLKLQVEVVKQSIVTQHMGVANVQHKNNRHMIPWLWLVKHYINIYMHILNMWVSWRSNSIQTHTHVCIHTLTPRVIIETGPSWIYSRALFLLLIIIGLSVTSIPCIGTQL